MRNGVRHPVEIWRLASDLYAEPVLFVSDLHKDCARVVAHVAGLLRPRDWAFVALGDLAGTERFGQDGDPTDDYLAIHRKFGRFYFVDGNHDRPRMEAYALANPDGSPCCLQGSDGLGSIGGQRLAGVSGIMSPRLAPGKLSPQVFEAAVEAALTAPGLHTFVTHDTPLISGFSPAIGNPLLAKLVTRRGPRVHVFGHCHLTPAFLAAGPTTFVNADRRVVLIEPSGS
jgi:predicted phosphodiesterase